MCGRHTQTDQLTSSRFSTPAGEGVPDIAGALRRGVPAEEGLPAAGLRQPAAHGGGSAAVGGREGAPCRGGPRGPAAAPAAGARRGRLPAAPVPAPGRLRGAQPPVRLAAHAHLPRRERQGGGVVAGRLRPRARRARRPRRPARAAHPRGGRRAVAEQDWGSGRPSPLEFSWLRVSATRAYFFTRPASKDVSIK